MAAEIEQLEREAEDARTRLQATMEELRGRMSPGAVFDRVIDHARRGPAGEYFRNLGREVQKNPMPVMLIAIGIAWLAVSTSRSARMLVASAAGSVSRKAAEIGAKTGEAAGRMAGRIGDAGEAIGTTANLAGRVRDAAGGVAERTEELSAIAEAVLGKEEWPLAGTPESGHLPPAAVRIERQPAEIDDRTSVRRAPKSAESVE